MRYAPTMTRPRSLFLALALALAGCTGSTATNDGLRQNFELQVERVVGSAAYRITITADDLAAFPYEGAMPTDQPSLLATLDDLEARIETGNLSVSVVATEDNPDNQDEGNFRLVLSDPELGRLGRSGILSPRATAESAATDITSLLGRPVGRDYWIALCGLDILSVDDGYRLARLSDAQEIEYVTGPYSTPIGAKRNVTYVNRRARDASNWTLFAQSDGTLALGVVDVNGTELLVGAARYARAEDAVFDLQDAPIAFASIPVGCRGE